MPKFFVRIVTLLLVSFLCGDAALAAAFHDSLSPTWERAWPHRTRGEGGLFIEQALASGATQEIDPLSSGGEVAKHLESETMHQRLDKRSSPLTAAVEPSLLETSNPKERDMARRTYGRRNSHFKLMPSDGPRIKNHIKGRGRTWKREFDYEESGPEVPIEISPQSASIPPAGIPPHWNAAWPLPKEEEIAQTKKILNELLASSQRRGSAERDGAN